MTTAEALAVVRSALEEVTPCGCPKGMKYHALNCGVAPGELQADAALALIEQRLGEVEAERDAHVEKVMENFARAERAEAERDNATAALERMRLELVRVDGMVSRYSQSADAVSEDRARWMERYAELEAALREIVDVGDLEGSGFVEDIARRALGVPVGLNLSDELGGF